jgi:hypothetical protein
MGKLRRASIPGAFRMYRPDDPRGLLSAPDYRPFVETERWFRNPEIPKSRIPEVELAVSGLIWHFSPL